MIAEAIHLLKDPVTFHKVFWPDAVLADYQVEVLRSLERNKITVVPAGNKLGKDYIAAFAGLHFFCSRRPARVITTSVDGSQLQGVLWGEIRNFIQTAAFPLPLHVNHLHLRQKLPDGTLQGNSEMIGRVVSKGEGLLGRHLPYGPDMFPHVLAIIDEASGFDDSNYMGIDTWAHRILIIGNPFPCENFFKKFVEEGDKKSDSPYLEYDTKIIKIPAVQSPNVQLSLAEERAGKELSRRIIVPGCMDIDDYRWRVKTYDPIKLSAGIHAEFYEGDEVRMYPQEWLRRSQEQAQKYKDEGTLRTGRKAMGIDTAEGGDNTVWTVVDRLGILKQISKKTHNTAVIKGMTIALMKEFQVAPEDVLFDHGGGGKEHADYLRAQGYDVDSVFFGESPTAPDEFEFGFTMPEERKELKEERYTYKNKRVQFYHILRLLLNPPPDSEYPPFAIPAELTELLRQLKPIPLQYDGEGRMLLPPKGKPTENYQGTTIKDMLGCSPDESDSLVLATFQISKPPMPVVGAF